MTEQTTAPAGVVSGNELGYALAAERERCAKLETAIQEALKQARTYPWASGTFILTLEDALTANANLSGGRRPSA